MGPHSENYFSVSGHLSCIICFIADVQQYALKLTDIADMRTVTSVSVFSIPVGVFFKSVRYFLSVFKISRQCAICADHKILFPSQSADFDRRSVCAYSGRLPVTEGGS